MTTKITKEMAYGSWFRDGDWWVVVSTGQPQDAVQVGYGPTITQAWESLARTPIQSVGRDCGEAQALRWAEGAGWIESVETLERVDIQQEAGR